MLQSIKDIFFQTFLFVCGCLSSLLYGDPLPIRKSRKVSEQNVRVVIIGAGISGIAMAKKLNDIDLTDYTILEAGADMGGVWYWNKYPGVECDVAAVTYSFSWNYNPNWSRAFPGGEEIQAYIVESARDQGIVPHIKFNTTVQKCEWLEDAGTWRLTTSSGEVEEANVVIHACGMLHQPKIPDIPGLETFKGAKVHSARWDESLDLCDKRVSVIGTGCSAIQIVPSIISRVSSLTLFQRSAPYVTLKSLMTADLKKSKNFQRFYDFTARAFSNSVWDVMWIRMTLKPDRWFSLAEESKAMIKVMMQDQVESPVHKEKIVPNYDIGVKRPTMSDDYLQSMNKPNFHLVTSEIKSVTESSIVTKTNQEIESDVIIFATGFDCLKSILAFNVTGQNGLKLEDFWKGSPKAFKGMCVPSMPNFFIMYGPNTVNNRMLMTECAANYASECILELSLSKTKSMTVKQGKYDEYNQSVERALAKRTFGTAEGGYFDDGQGKNWQLYPWLLLAYQWDTYRCNKNDFDWRN